MVATVTFGASLGNLVSHPALYGWNWDHELLGTYGGFADVPEPRARRLLDRDPDVAGWADVTFDALRVDGQTVPVLGTTVRADVGPPEIVNYRTMRTTPALLGAALAIGAIVALGLTLVASVRSRRRDLAILKTLGFADRQLAATVAWQSSVAVTVGVVIGAPLGIIAGRVLWNLFANALHVVPQPSVPSLTITFIALGALVLANLVAAPSGLQAARTRTSVLLHAE